jgi:hypothetical protein
MTNHSGGVDVTEEAARDEPDLDPWGISVAGDARISAAGRCRVTAFDRCVITVHGDCEVTAYDDCQIVVQSVDAAR